MEVKYVEKGWCGDNYVCNLKQLNVLFIIEDHNLVNVLWDWINSSIMSNIY